MTHRLIRLRSSVQMTSGGVAPSPLCRWWGLKVDWKSMEMEKLPQEKAYVCVCVYTCLCPHTGGAGGPAERLLERKMRILAWEIKLMLAMVEKLTWEPVWMWRVGFPRPVPDLWWCLSTSRQCVLGTLWNKGLSTGTHSCLEYRFLKAIWQCVSGLKGPYPLTQ